MGKKYMPLPLKLIVLLIHLRDLALRSPAFLVSKYYVMSKVSSLPSLTSEEADELIAYLVKWGVLLPIRRNGVLYSISADRALEFSRLSVEDYLRMFIPELR